MYSGATFFVAIIIIIAISTISCTSDKEIKYQEGIKLIQQEANYLGVKVDLVPKEDIREELKENILKGAVYL